MTQAIRSNDSFGVPASIGTTNAALSASALIAANRGTGFDAQGLARDLGTANLQSPGEVAALEAAVFAQLSPREQGELMRAQSTAPRYDGPSTAETVADLAQMALDIVGIVEPTPFADGTNAVISLGRSIGSAFGGEWGEAGGHLFNGTLSAVGIVPYLGDAAKVGKIGKWASTVADAVSMAARNPASRAALEGPMREIRDLVDRIPQSAIDSLPAGARESLERMKSQLDDFFSGGARAADGITVQRFTSVADFNRAANNAAPNTRYEFGSYSYTTDANGRVASAEGTISLTPAGRNDPDLQRQIGDEGRPTDVGFHLIGDRFGGQTNRLNVVPGNGAPIGDGLPNLNQGAFKRFENEVARIAGQPGNTVEVRIGAEYDPGNLSTRPDSLVAEYRVNSGAWRTRTFDNK